MATLTGRYIARDDDWRAELYGVGVGGISASPAFTYTSANPGPFQGDAQWSMGGLNTCRDATFGTSEPPDWAPTKTADIRYALRFYVHDQDVGDWVLLYAGFVADVTGAADPSAARYSIVCKGLRDVNAGGLIVNGSVTVAGWLGLPEYITAPPSQQAGETWENYMQRFVAPQTAGDWGVTPDGHWLAGTPTVVGSSPVNLDAYTTPQYSGNQRPPYISELSASPGGGWAPQVQQRIRPSVLTPRTSATASVGIHQVTTSGPSLVASSETGYTAPGLHYAVYDLGGWVNNAASDTSTNATYQPVAASFGRRFSMLNNTSGWKAKANYGWAVTTSSSAGALTGDTTPDNPTWKVAGAIESAAAETMLSPSTDRGVGLSVDIPVSWLAPRGYGSLYLWVVCNMGPVYNDPVAIALTQAVASGDTHLSVGTLSGPIPSGTILTFKYSGGGIGAGNLFSITTSQDAMAGDTQIAINAAGNGIATTYGALYKATGPQILVNIDTAWTATFVANVANALTGAQIPVGYAYPFESDPTAQGTGAGIPILPATVAGQYVASMTVSYTPGGATFAYQTGVRPWP